MYIIGSGAIGPYESDMALGVGQKQKQKKQKHKQ